MSPPFASSLADLRVAGYYLPAVSFGYLFTQSQSSGYFWLSALGLVAAVSIHGVLRAFPDTDAATGTTGATATATTAADSARGAGHRRRPGPPPTTLQLTYAALHGSGNPASYPATLRQAVRNPALPGGLRAVVAAGFVVLVAVFVALVPYSAWVLWTELPLDGMGPTYHLIGQTLVFLTAMWVLQTVGWRFSPTVTVARRPAARGAQDGLEELRTFLTGPGGPDGVTHITYESRAGGYVLIDYVTGATTHDGLRAELEDVAIGYLANALNEKYPCEEVSVSVLGDDRAPIGSFAIDGDWADAYADGDITVRDYVERVWDSLELYRTSGRGLLAADSQTDDDLQAGLATGHDADADADAGSTGHNATGAAAADDAHADAATADDAYADAATADDAYADAAAADDAHADAGSSASSGPGSVSDTGSVPGSDTGFGPTGDDRGQAHDVDAAPSSEATSDTGPASEPGAGDDAEPPSDTNETNPSFG